MQHNAGQHVSAGLTEGPAGSAAAEIASPRTPATAPFAAEAPTVAEAPLIPAEPTAADIDHLDQGMATPPPAPLDVPGLAPAAGSSGALHENPAEAVIRSFVESLSRLARSHRDAVREAGGIAPLVTLLRSGTGEIQAITAAVLRDLATDNPENQAAILEAGGLHELVDMVRKDAGAQYSGECAGALRALSSDFPAGCKAIIETNGVQALVSMVERGEPGSISATQATGALANLAKAEVKNCEAILRAGGIPQLVGLLSRGHSTVDAHRRRLPSELKARLESSAEEACNALWQLAAQAPSCNAAIRRANAIGPLIDTLLRSGLDSANAQFAAKAVVELVQRDEDSRTHALEAIVRAANDENFDGHGWSLSFPHLRQLLQGAAERMLQREEEGNSASGIQYAIEIGRAVELPQPRLDDARNAFEEGQARRKREKLSEQAEARRKAKEEELVQRAAARALAEEERAAAEARTAEEASGPSGGRRHARKERIPSSGAPGMAPADSAQSPRRTQGGDIDPTVSQAPVLASRAAAGAVGGAAPSGAPAQLSARAAKEARLQAGRKYNAKDAIAEAKAARAEAKAEAKAEARANGSESHRPGSTSHRLGTGSHRSGSVSHRGPDSHRHGGVNQRKSQTKRSRASQAGEISSTTVAAVTVAATAAGAKAAAAKAIVPPPASELSFVPRAQLLEKIERIAALNRSAPPSVPTPTDVSETDVIGWMNRWDAKYQRMLGTAGFESGFSGKADDGRGHTAGPAPPRPPKALQLIDKPPSPPPRSPPSKQSRPVSVSGPAASHTAQERWQTVRTAFSAGSDFCGP
jgi:hypothetical protein